MRERRIFLFLVTEREKNLKSLNMNFVHVRRLVISILLFKGFFLSGILNLDDQNTLKFICF